MKTVTLTRGLPGSGKTTWAKTVLAEHPGTTKIVCKDDLRAMLDDGRWSKANESFVIALRNKIIIDALSEGWHVIVADTNLNPIHIHQIEMLLQTYKPDIGEVHVDVEDFTDVPIEECIRRDLLRPNSVGEKVIREQYKKWLAPKPADPPARVQGPPAIVVDLDGTVALHNGRNPFDHTKLMQDIPNRVVLDLIEARAWQHQMILGSKVHILITSGRDSVARDGTEAWLCLHGIKYDQLWMRPEGDKRKDTVVKEEIYRREIEGKYNVLCVFDDRNSVVEFWRSLGLICLQVADGDF
jgi:predicted kinase